MRQTLILIALVMAPALAACEPGQSNNQAVAPPPPTVTVAKPISKDIVDHDEYVGRFVAVDFVEIRARVSGYLDAIHFQDGQIVKKGDLLMTVDRRPFEAALAQAKANLAQAQANLAFAESDLARGKGLDIGTVITQQTLDMRTQAKNVAQASVLMQQAAVRQAELDLEFSELRAPVSGRIGDRRVAVGNLVTGGTSGTTTLLATIESTDPIRFEFTIDEGSYLRYANFSKDSADGKVRGGGLPIQLKLIGEKSFSHEGKVDFVDNAISPSSGTIRIRGVLANADGRFTPGMFARVQLSASAPTTALLVPDAAVGSQQARKFVLVVDDGNVAHQKYVTLGPYVDGLRAITSGLAPDDNVIVNGLPRARPGSKVTPQLASITSDSAAVANVSGR